MKEIPEIQDIRLEKDPVRKVKRRRLFVQGKIGEILGLKKDQRKSIDIPVHTLSRMFEKDKVKLKKRFQVSKRLKGLNSFEEEFEDRKLLLESGDLNDKVLHELEVLFYVLKTQNSQFLLDQGVDETWIKEKYKTILIGAIRQRVQEFDNRGKYTATRRKIDKGPLDIKKMRKLLQFRNILHHYGFSDDDIGIPTEKFNEIKTTIQETTSKIKFKK